MELPAFPDSADLPTLQAYMQAVCEARGWDSDSPERKFLLFTEEIGELAKAIRQHEHLYQETNKTPENPLALAEEFADVFSYLLDLANTFQVDLTQAFKAKELKNAQRSWE